MRYLVVEDDPEMSALLKRGLENEIVKIVIAGDGEAALVKIRNDNFDVLILDVNLPKISGLELARRVRAEGYSTPILFLTAQDSLSDKVAGFDVGGDDYLVKPFEFVELNARINALKRRSGARTNEILIYGNIRLDVLSQRTFLGEKQIVLSPREFALLALLLRNIDTIFSRKQILVEIWDGSDFVDPNIVDQYISYIRRKIDRGIEPSIIETIRGVGYRVPRIET